MGGGTTSQPCALDFSCVPVTSAEATHDLSSSSQGHREVEVLQRCRSRATFTSHWGTWDTGKFSVWPRGLRAGFSPARRTQASCSLHPTPVWQAFLLPITKSQLSSLETKMPKNPQWSQSWELSIVDPLKALYRVHNNTSFLTIT